MAKSKRDDRRQPRRSREPREIEEHVLQVARVSRVVKGGRRMRFRVVVVIGNRKGKVGIGIGKATEVQAAVQKATAQARRRMIQVPIVRGTIPHQVDLKFKAAKIRILPAGEGTGIIAGGALRPILELAGVRNVLSKRFGTNNQLVNAQAAIRALRMLREPVRKETNGTKESSLSPDLSPEARRAKGEACRAKGEAPIGAKVEETRPTPLSEGEG